MGARVAAAIIQVQADLRGLVFSCWPGHVAENVFASCRRDCIFLQNISDAVDWFKNAELAPYGTAIYKKNGDALELVYNQTAFTWRSVK